MQSAVRLFFAIALVLMAAAPVQSAPSVSFKRNTAIILFSSLGGAILGLSTLSFYGEPENHLGNITTGAAVGAGLGVAYVFSRPRQPQNSFQDVSFSQKRGYGDQVSVKLPIQIRFEF